MDHHKLPKLCGVVSAVLMLFGTTACTMNPAPVSTLAMPAEDAPALTLAHPVTPGLLKPDYPEIYVVQRGDTLWDIAGHFLRDPWRWPEFWHHNPQVANPHLIYPGDVLALTYIDGKPTLSVRRGVAEQPTRVVKLSPRIRSEELQRAIPTIPLDAIRPFLSRTLIVSEHELEQTPYVVSSMDARLIAGEGHTVYVRDLKRSDRADFTVVRRGQVYRDPLTRKVLGYEALQVADARVQRFGNPSTLTLVHSNREVLNGDRIVPAGTDYHEFHFMPRAPKGQIDGHIVAVVDGVTQIGQYQVVVLNRGLQDDLEPGHVLAVYQDGNRVRDPVRGDQVQLPRERAGNLMVFRVFDHLSYALVMDAVRPMHVADSITNP